MAVKLLLIGVGGGVGSILRALVALFITERVGGTFPLATLTINVTGCLLIGLLSTVIGARWGDDQNLRAALLVGLLGGYTTFSTFGFETVTLLREQLPLQAAAYVSASVFLGVLAVWLGQRCGDALT